MMSYYVVQIGLMTVKINKHFSIQSVIFEATKRFERPLIDQC